MCHLWLLTTAAIDKNFLVCNRVHEEWEPAWPMRLNNVGRRPSITVGVTVLLTGPSAGCSMSNQEEFGNQ